MLCVRGENVLVGGFLCFGIVVRDLGVTVDGKVLSGWSYGCSCSRAWSGGGGGWFWA